MAKKTDKTNGRVARRRKPGPTKGEQTRERLFSAAIEEFGLRGYHGPKVSDIVRRAKVSQPTYYMYFSSKLSLYKHLVKRVRTDLLAIIDKAIVPPNLSRDDASRGAVEGIKLFIRYFSENPKLAVIGYFEAEESEKLRQEIATVVARNVTAEKRSGYLREDIDPMFFSQCYNGSLDRVIRKYLLTGKKSVDEIAADAA